MRVGERNAGDRPRERLLARGADALSDAELVSLLLGHGVAGVSAVDVAHALLARFGSLTGLLGAPVRRSRQRARGRPGQIGEHSRRWSSSSAGR